MTHVRSGQEQRALRRTLNTRASMEVEQAAAYIATLASALRSGGVTIRSKEGLVALRTGKTISLDLEAGEEGRHTVVKWELRWETPSPDEHLEIASGVQDAAPVAASGGARASRGSPPGNGQPDAANKAKR
jgi:amphi-Trp domain-containing protein